jgi:hypothetical protein
MMVAEAVTHRNGTATSAMPIKTIEIALDEIGYPGWVVTMRTNPRASVYDDLVSGDVERWWPAFGQVVRNWNFADEDGRALELPANYQSEQELDLPIGVIAFVLNRYFEAFAAAAALPKGSDANSSTTLSTNTAERSAE